jgi:molybdopterin-binding protein
LPKEIYTATEAARALGISLDTLRRSNRRLVPASEVDRLRGGAEPHVLSARNRFRGVVHDVEVDGLLAKVEIEVTEPARVVAIITRESAEALGLKPGMSATGIVKATSVMVER